MCRRQHLLGCVLFGFGLGLLLGHCVESGFVCICGGTALLILGLSNIRKK